MKALLTTVAASLLIAPTIAWAQASHGGHDGHAAPGSQKTQPSSQGSASTLAFEAVNEKMHKDMDIKFTGNTDRDFLLAMIPHHQGAIDMAGVVLEYGKDPKVRALAEQIILEQQKEIALMQELLKQLER